RGRDGPSAHSGAPCAFETLRVGCGLGSGNGNSEQRDGGRDSSRSLLTPSVIIVQPMPRILVVEDDTDIAELIAHYLTGAGHTVERLTSGRDVLPRLRREPVDLVILDIMLTARGDEADRISGLEQGADDYVTKPFSPKELTARVNALLRRLTRPAT